MSLANSDRAKGNPVDHFQTLILFVLTIFTSATIHGISWFCTYDAKHFFT